MSGTRQAKPARRQRHDSASVQCCVQAMHSLVQEATDDVIPRIPAAPGAPGWYPDPFGRAEVRYHDGRDRTSEVASHGRPATDQPGGAARVPTVNRLTEKVRRDVAKAGVTTGAVAGGGTLFTEPSSS